MYVLCRWRSLACRCRSTTVPCQMGQGRFWGAMDLWCSIGSMFLFYRKSAFDIFFLDLRALLSCWLAGCSERMDGWIEMRSGLHWCQSQYLSNDRSSRLPSTISVRGRMLDCLDSKIVWKTPMPRSNNEMKSPSMSNSKRFLLV